MTQRNMYHIKYRYLVVEDGKMDMLYNTKRSHCFVVADCASTATCNLDKKLGRPIMAIEEARLLGKCIFDGDRLARILKPHSL